MRKGSRNTAFTLIELLVVVAIIALLLSILLPSLSGAREQGKRAKCLANLSNLGKAVYQYGNEDPAEQIIPIHMNMVRTCSYWEWRTVNWFAWGGRSGQIPFRTGSSAALNLSDEDRPGIKKPEYAADRRPLNIYMLDGVGTGDSKKMEWFHCPSDRGYPDDPYIDDSPQYNSERSCYDSMGNSYRASMAMFGDMGSGTQGPSNGHFAIGPWGHRISSLLNTGRLVLMGEPSWFNMIGSDSVAEVDEVTVLGWHKRKMVDNLLFCDGSARSTKAEKECFVDSDRLIDVVSNMELLNNRGTSYQLDTFPVPGAIIWGDWDDLTQSDKWPGRGAQDNLRR